MTDDYEIEALEPLEELDYIHPELDKENSLASHHEEMVIWSETSEHVKNYRNSYIPIATLDSRLKIVSYNESFFQQIIRGAEVSGFSLFQILDPFENAKQTIEIHKSLKSELTGFSWRGRVKVSHKDFLTIEANALISPVFPSGESLRGPMGYLCIFDDVTEENRNLLHKTFLSLLEASKLKDNDTGFHIKRVGEYSRILAKHLFSLQTYPEVDAQFIEDITFLAPMHDVGKIGTPDEILHKKGPLTEWEWEIMREHTINGGFILGSYPSPMANQIPLFHHERWDGSGYPYQFSENMIPLAARIVALADVYDALRMSRSYKEGFSHEKAASIIEQGAGKHFDPFLVKQFFILENRFEDTFNMLADKP
jgi:putative two-component system response regulator